MSEYTADTSLNDKHGFETQVENLFKDRTEHASAIPTYGAVERPR